MDFWELLSEGIKKFAGEIIAAILFTVLFMLFPSLRKFFKNRNSDKNQLDTKQIVNVVESTIQEKFDSQKINTELIQKQTEARLQAEIQKEKLRLQSEKLLHEQELKKIEDARKLLEETRKQEQARKQAEIQLQQANIIPVNSSQQVDDALQKSNVFQNQLVFTNTDAQSQFELGEKFFQQENYDKAFSCFQKAAELGYSDAQFKLGECYYEGKGIYEDQDEAVVWFEKAAQQGNTNAQFKLGKCYYEGKGLEQDDEKAISWYEKAAQQGHSIHVRQMLCSIIG